MQNIDTRTFAASVPQPPDSICCAYDGDRGTSPRISAHKAAKLALITFALLTLYCTTGQTQVAAKQLVTYTLQKPEEAEKGKPFNINVLFNIEPEWYIYAPTGTNSAQGMIETKVTYSLPAGMTREGRMEVPEAIFKNGYEVLEGKGVVMRQAFKAAKPGHYEIKGKVIWQTCSTDVCLPPVTDEFIATININ